METSAARTERPYLHLVLLGATVVTTFLTFLVFHTNAKILELIVTREDALSAVAFSFTAIAILGTHEMGHYVAARLHGVSTTLPYFIPFPLGFGTLGAVIRIRSRIPTRNALMDIGAAGPLAGLAVAIPLLYIGVRLSTLVEVTPVQDSFPAQLSVLSLLRSAFEWTQGAPAEAAGTGLMIYSYGEPLLLQGLTYLVYGPLPETTSISAHPMVLAGWFGLLVTTLNLFPIGQLDGGHVAYAALGKYARTVGRLTSLGLLLMTLFFSVQWLLWWILTMKIIGFGHPPVVTPEEPLSRGRVVVAVLSLIALVVCILPVPITVLFQ